MNLDINSLTPLRFPDGTPHVRLDVPGVPFTADVRARLRTPEDLWLLLSAVDSIREHDGTLGRLDLPYLMGTRYDRPMARGDAMDLRVVARAINSCGFRKVRVLDPHSDVFRLIDGAQAVSNEFLVRQYLTRGAVLIVPDAGAAKKVKDYRAWAYVTDEVQCVKSRDAEGHVRLQVLNPEACSGRHCVVVDDVCDGGATFGAIAQQIKPLSLTLVVTHGIFSRGLTALGGYDTVITSDSFRSEIPRRIGDPEVTFVHCPL